MVAEWASALSHPWRARCLLQLGNIFKIQAHNWCWDNIPEVSSASIIYISAHTHTHIDIYYIFNFREIFYDYTCIYIHTHVYIYIYVRFILYVYVYMYIYIYVFLYIYIYRYVHKGIPPPLFILSPKPSAKRPCHDGSTSCRMPRSLNQPPRRGLRHACRPCDLNDLRKAVGRKQIININQQLKVDYFISLPGLIISLYQSLLPIAGEVRWMEMVDPLIWGSGGIYHCRDAVARVFANSLAATGLLEQSGGLVMCCRSMPLPSGKLT